MQTKHSHGLRSRFYYFLSPPTINTHRVCASKWPQELLAGAQLPGSSVRSPAALVGLGPEPHQLQGTGLWHRRLGPPGSQQGSGHLSHWCQVQFQPRCPWGICRWHLCCSTAKEIRSKVRLLSHWQTTQSSSQLTVQGRRGKADPSPQGHSPKKGVPAGNAIMAPGRLLYSWAKDGFGLPSQNAPLMVQNI